MNKNEEEILSDILNSITRYELYRFSKDTLDMDLESNIWKENLIIEILKKIKKSKVHFDKLINFINDVQEWGRQHIFLYRSNPEIRSRFKAMTLEQLSNILVAHRTGIKPNTNYSIFLPDKEGFDLYKVQHNEGKSISFFWAERRTIKTRLEEKDYVENELEYHAWKLLTSRGLLVFDWNLINGQMMIRVSQAESKTTYEKGRVLVLDFTKKILGIDPKNWNQLDIRKAIANIKDSDEVSTKKYNQESASGGKQSLQARDKRHGIEKDTELTQASKVMRNRFASTYGNFFWKLDDEDNIEKEVHTTIDSKTNSLLIFGIQTEATVRYILGRIIHYLS